MKVYFAETNPALLIHSANLATLGKKPGTVVLKPEWYFDQMLAEHSTLDFSSLIVEDTMRADVCRQIVRHTKHHPRFAMQSKRPDWTGEARPTDPAYPVQVMMKWPIRALLAASHERLCRKAMKETREWFENLVVTLWYDANPLAKALSRAMVPICVYRYDCPFKKSCGFFASRAWPVKLEERYAVYTRGLS